MAEAHIGDTSSTLTGGTVVWTGTEWAPVKTEALTPAEYAAKFPKPHKSGDADFDELMDEANAWDAAQQAVDEVDATIDQPWLWSTRDSEHAGRLTDGVFLCRRRR